MEPISVKEVAEATQGKVLCGDPQTLIKSVVTDSRDVLPGSLFVPIIGERVDAHKFLTQVFESGAAAVFTSHGEVVDPDKVHIQVEDTEKAIGALSTYYRSKFPIPAIGVTGSVGKTSTKETIAAALSVKYEVLKTAGNQNSQIGVPLTMFRIESKHEIAVVEMGISDFGEMDDLVDFACPQVGIVTNIGVAHIGQLGSQENIMKEKLRIARDFTEDNCLFLNGDDPLLTEAAKTLTCPVVLFGAGKHCSYRAEDVRIVDGKTNFDYVYPTDAGEAREVIVINQLGLHNVYNAVVALAISQRYGIEPKVAKEGLAAYKGVAMRQQINHLKDGIKVIDDTYNASPDSIKSGVDVLLQLDNTGRKIAVLGDVLELGENSYQCHYDTGVHIAGTQIHEVVTVGTEMKALAKAIDEHNPEIVTISFDTNEDAIVYLLGQVGENDAVLVKGSRGMHEEEVVNALKEAFSA